MEKLLTAPEAAELLGVSERTVRNLTRAGELASVAVGRRSIRICPETLVRYATEHETA